MEVERVGENRLPPLLAGDVVLERLGTLAELLRQLPRARTVGVAEQQPRVLLRQAPRRRRADAAGRAGDQRDLARQPSLRHLATITTAPYTPVKCRAARARAATVGVR